MTIVLYDLVGRESQHRFSPYCWRAKMALKHKGLDFELRDWHFTEKDAIAFSGQGRVPVLVDADETVTDSWDIACYLEEAYPDCPSLFPGPSGRSMSLFFKFWCEKDLHPLVLKAVLPELFKRVSDRDRDYFRRSREQRFGCTLEDAMIPADQACDRLQSLLMPVREVLQQHAFLAGDRPAFVDYILFGVFQWARVTSPVALLERETLIRQWFDNLLDAFDGYGRAVPAAQ